MCPLPLSFSYVQPDFALVLARVRRLAATDNKRIAAALQVPPRKIENLDTGREPDYPTGAALLALLERLGGNAEGLMRRR